jgi:hypothetical protein
LIKFVTRNVNREAWMNSHACQTVFHAYGMAFHEVWTCIHVAKTSIHASWMMITQT